MGLPIEPSLIANASQETIWTAVADGNFDRVKQFIETCLDGDKSNVVNSQDSLGYSLLHAAVSWNHVEIVKFLLDHHADISIKDQDGDTPLHYCEDPEIAKMLIEHGADPLCRNGEGLLPIQVASEDDRESMVNYLKQFTPDIALDDLSGQHNADGAIQLDLNDLVTDMQNEAQDQQ